MESGKQDIETYFKYSEGGIKVRNPELYELIVKYQQENNLTCDFKAGFYLMINNKKLPKCYCGNDVKFIDMKNGFREFCSRRCMLDSKEIKDKKRESCLIKYGVDNPSKAKEIKEKVKKTNQDKFGVDYPLQSEDIKKKTREYFLEEYGVDNPSKLKEVREKAELTNLEKWGVRHVLQNDDIIKKVKSHYKEMTPTEKERIIKKFKSTNIIKWGVDNYSKTELFKEKIKIKIFDKNLQKVNNDTYKLLDLNVSEYIIQCQDCQSPFTIQRQLYNNRIRIGDKICLNCNPIINGRSKKEIEVLEFIKNYIKNIENNFRLEGKEIDIYLPDLKIGFEFNVLWWHSEINKPKSYHQNKQKFFLERGIKIYFINEDDWMFRKEIVKSIILNKLGKIENKIWARKCEVKKITDNNLVRKFLNENHIQGYINSSIKIGLFYQGELVSLITFGKLRKALGSKSNNNEFELLRFCSKINYNIIGGASKLFKYFIKNYQFNKVISYSDNGRSDGNLYQKLGFTLDKECGINYYWCKNYNKYHRFNFRKDKLVQEGFDPNKTEVEIMYDRGYFRFFDAGSKKWIYINNI